MGSAGPWNNPFPASLFIPSLGTCRDAAYAAPQKARVKVNSGQIALVLGGARCGKSSFAQAFAEDETGDLIYIATAQAFDAEMTERIARHRSDRGPRWQTVECPLGLADAIAEHQGEGKTILVDCDVTP